MVATVEGWFNDGTISPNPLMLACRRVAFVGRNCRMHAYVAILVLLKIVWRQFISPPHMKI
jgi:hypothetical protein